MALISYNKERIPIVGKLAERKKNKRSFVLFLYQPALDDTEVVNYNTVLFQDTQT